MGSRCDDCIKYSDFWDVRDDPSLLNDRIVRLNASKIHNPSCDFESMSFVYLGSLANKIKAKLGKKKCNVCVKTITDYEATIKKEIEGKSFSSANETFEKFYHFSNKNCVFIFQIGQLASIVNLKIFCML